MNSKIIAGSIIGGIVAAGAAATWYLMGGGLDRPIKDIKPDEPATPPIGPSFSGKTGYKRIDAILDDLRAAIKGTIIPLGLVVGWIAKESGGRLVDTTSLDERGYFQLMPSESKTLGVDHQRLSTDSDYSIDAGIKLIQQYQKTVESLNAASTGSNYFWKLVKLAHSMGSGQTKKVVKAAKDAGQADTWEDLKAFALGMSIRGPQPKKWMPFIDLVVKVGQPFGFGSESTNVGYMLRSGLDLLGVA